MSHPHSENTSDWLKLLLASRDAPYPLAAYIFVYEACEPLSSTDAAVDAISICNCLRDNAIKHFGVMALGQLADWNIFCSLDLGEIVIDLVQCGAITGVSIDNLEDFAEAWDFNEFIPEAGGRHKWTLATLFLFMTFAAMAFAGYGRLEGVGPIGTLFCSWMGFVGLVLVVAGIRDRSQGWLMAFCLGVAVIVISMIGFFTIVAQSRVPL